MSRAGLTLPNVFGTKTVKGPLSDLDANFNPLKNAILDSGNGFVSIGVVSGTANALVLTCTPPCLTLAAGTTIAFGASLVNTGAVTVNVDGLGAKSLTDYGGNALIGGEIAGPVIIVYNGATFVLFTALGVNQTYAFPTITAFSGSLANPTLNVVAQFPLTIGTISRTATTLASISGGNVLVTQKDGLIIGLCQADRAVSTSRIYVNNGLIQIASDISIQMMSFCLPCHLGGNTNFQLFPTTGANWTLTGQVYFLH